MSFWNPSGFKISGEGLHVRREKVIKGDEKKVSIDSLPTRRSIKPTRPPKSIEKLKKENEGKHGSLPQRRGR